MVTEEKALDVLSSEINQEQNSGMYFAKVLKDMSSISREYAVRVLDFNSRRLSGTTAPIAPFASVVDNQGKKKLNVSGFAIFKDDKMVYKLDSDETAGYIFAMGNVKRWGLTVEADEGEAGFFIKSLHTDRKVLIEENGRVRVMLDINAILSISEVNGFERYKAKELQAKLTELSQEEIKKMVLAAFETTKKLNTDIYGFGESVHKKYAKEWNGGLRESWEVLYPTVVLEVDTAAEIEKSGQIINSPEMKEEVHYEAK